MAKRTMERDWERKVITILGVEYDYKALSAEIQDKCGFLGYGTKLVDRLAGMKAYTDEEKVEAVNKVNGNLLQGQWRQPGEGKTSAKAERAKVMEAYEKASKADKAVMRKCLTGQGYMFPEDK